MKTLLNPNEAPKGYYAVLKKDAAIPAPGGGIVNYCRSCDWRKACQDPGTDLYKHDHRCMDYAIITNKGMRIQRKDKCSVVFKKI